MANPRSTRRNNNLEDIGFTQVVREATTDLDRTFPEPPEEEEELEEPKSPELTLPTQESSSSDESEDEEDYEYDVSTTEHQEQASMPPPPLTQNRAEAVDTLLQFQYVQQQSNHHQQPMPPHQPTATAAAPSLGNQVQALMQHHGLQEDGNLFGSGHYNAKDILQGSGLTDQEKNFIQSNNRGKNTNAYEQGKDALERRFFDTLVAFGGTALQPLTEMIPMDFGNGVVLDRAFYRLMAGPKTPEKKKQIKACLMLCFMKWTCSTGARKGGLLEPATFDKYMQKLSYVWRDKGIQYNYKIDFNTRGGFHGLVIQRWQQYRQSDPMFGTNRNKSVCVDGFAEKVANAIASGEIKPYEVADDLQMVVIFIIGYFAGIRGQTEHVNITMEEFCIEEEHTLESGGQDLVGLKYCGPMIPFNKARQLKLGKTTLKPGQAAVKAITEDPNAGETRLDPFQLIQFYLSKCNPDAKKLYAKPFTAKQRINLQKE